MDMMREDQYDRHFDALSRLAEDLKVPAAEAEELINDILMSILFKRNITDLDTWLAGAFRTAVKHREARAC
jgi:hypothetical protein